MHAALRRIFIALLALTALCSLEAMAQSAPISRSARFTGNVNFVAAGGSLRTAPNSTNACAVGSTSTGNLTGIPGGATIQAAYLYWGGSGATTDSSVTLNGSTINASRTFTVNATSPTRTFFGGFADVTSQIGGNALLTFGGLSVDTGGNYCSSATVVAGWGLVVIYSRASEPLRAINVFDGLESFLGSAVTLTPNGFRIPASGIDGKIAVITWDGDPGNSGSSGGFSESLRFNGTSLDDGIVVPGSDPPTQQYDGTINTLGIATSYGVDVDTYNVTTLLVPGQTSANTVYSAGDDRVLLTAQIVSVTSEPIVDLALTKTHTGNFTVGTNATYSLTVSSEPGSQQTDFPIVVTDTLPAGLTFVSGSGTGWSCGAAGQLATCTHAGPLNASASLPPVTLTVAVGNAAYTSVTNTAQVTTPSNDPDTSNNSATDTATVLGSNLSTSTKTVQDLNGGDANPGDTLRYTITLIETAGVAATAVTVTDDVPANVSGFSVSSIPSGAANTSTGTGTGANNTGYLNVTGITVPASGSATVIFDVQVAAGASPGTTIDNTATVDAPGGIDATPSAPQVIVSQSLIPGSGTKQLYLWSNPVQLNRTPPSGVHGTVPINGNNVNVDWTIAPALQMPVSLQAGGFAVPLILSRTGSTSFTSNRTVTVTLLNSMLGVVGSAAQSFTSGTPTLYTFTLNTSGVTAPAGSTFTLRINNNSGAANRSISVTPYSVLGYSRVELNSLSVINVDSVQTYNAVYPGGAATTNFSRNTTAYVRAVVSDPFGSFDIAGANVTILDPSSTVIANNVVMTQVADSGAATRTYEYAFAVPANAPAGGWTVRVVAREGTENTVTDLGVGSFNVVLPSLQVQKISEVLSDPVNGATNPKRIPNSIQRYSITVTNTGAGTVDAGSLALSDPVPSDVALYVSTSGGPPVEFIDGSTSSGLSYSYAGNVSYSSQPGGGPPFSHTPNPDADGFDAAITGIRVAPTGTMNGAVSVSTPSFVIRFRVRVR